METWNSGEFEVFSGSKSLQSWSQVRLTCLQNLSVMVSAVPDCLRQIPLQERI